MDYPRESGIYMISNRKNNKQYIGQSQNIDARIRMHLCLLRNGKHYNCHLQSAWNKYGYTAFDISVLELCPVSDLNDREMYYICKYDSFQSGYNRTVGGDGIRGTVMSEASRAKMRESHFDCSRGNHPQARSVVLLNTGEIFDCIVDAADKYGISKCDISGNAKRQAHSAGSFNGKRLVWAYKEDYDAMSSSDIEQLLFKAQNCKRGKMCYKAKPVICISTGEKFDLITDAAVRYGISRSVIGAACNGKQKHAGRDKNTGEQLEWMFYKDYLNNCANSNLLSYSNKAVS